MNFLDRRFLNFSLSVLAIANEPADNPTAGSQYIVGSNPTGAFAAASTNQIARYNGSAWSFISPKNGELEVLNLSNGQFLSFNGSAWTSVASISGNSSSGSSSLDYVTVVQGVVRSGTKPDNYFGLFLVDGAVQNPIGDYLNLSNRDSFLSLSDAKIYTFNADSYSFSEYSSEKGQIFFNSDSHDLGFYLADSSGSISKIGTLNNIQSVDSFVHVYFEAVNPYELDDFKDAHKTDGFSFIYGTKLFSYSSDAWHDRNFIEGERFFILSFNNTTDANPVLNPRIYEASEANNNGTITIYNYYEIFTGNVLLNKSDGCLYLFDGSNVSKVGNSSGSASSYEPSIFTEHHSLTAAEATAKSFSLTHNIAQGQETNTLLFVSGLAQTAGIDFSASANSISWNNKALDDIPLAVGDNFLIQYIKA